MSRFAPRVSHGLEHSVDRPGNIFRRNDGNSSLTRDQTIAIIGIFASVFGTSCVYFFFTYAKKYWQRRVERRAAVASDISPEDNDESVPVAQPTIVNNYNLNIYPQRPPPVAVPDIVSATTPLRVRDLERVFTWPRNERPR